MYNNLGKPRKIPSPAPFCFLESTRAPATWRRYVQVTRLAKLNNPFPLIKIPRRRLMNPWTLGAIPHEVAHNLQSDLGLWLTIPRQILRASATAGLPKEVARIWARWHKEIFADLCGVLLIGPAFVSAMMDLVSRTPEKTGAYKPTGVHPVPYYRVLILLELLRHMGFEKEAAIYRSIWSKLYPHRRYDSTPMLFRKRFREASQLVVKVICFQRYEQLGGKSLSEVVMFSPNDQALTLQAAQKLSAGTVDGIIPDRFLIGASRIALDKQFARPELITKHFYEGLRR